MNPAKEALAKKWLSEGIVRDNAIIDAFLSVPRELFVPKEYERDAYADYPLPIPAGQTISQPTTVMMMTQALEPKKGGKILEVGTGSGYQAAILAHIVGKSGKIISTEIISELVLFSKANLQRAQVKNVQVIGMDGSRGYGIEAPYDRIIVTAASPKIPKQLVEQLREGGIIVIPVGPRYSQQMIKAVKKNGKLVQQSIGDFIFVPLTGEEGQN